MVDIDLNKVIKYSKEHCGRKSQSLCALYVKRAFEAGGAVYKSGNGWNNQSFCRDNDFVCIGDFVPVDNNPRAHGNKPIQFPEGYKQQIGDICLIKHGTYGHICYAYGPTINDWVSDYWQNSTLGSQMDGTGPYCYSSGYERVQFWRHKSFIGDTKPIVDVTDFSDVHNTIVETPHQERSASSTHQNSGTNTVQQLATINQSRTDVLKQTDGRKQEFGTLLNSMINEAPELGVSIVRVPEDEMYDTNILKGSQESKKEKS